MTWTVEDLRDLAELLRAHPEWREPLWALLASEEVRRMPAELAALRAEVDRRFAELAEAIRNLSETFAIHRVETDRRFAELAEAQRRHYEEFIAHRAETDRRFAEMADTIRNLNETFAAHRQEFLEHRQEFLEHRAETDRRFAELAEAQRRTEEALAAHRAETDRRFAELAEAQRRHYEEFVAQRAETDRRFAEMAEAIRALTQRVSDLDGLTRGWIHEDRYRTRSRRYRHLLLDPHILSVEEREQLLREAEAAGRLTAEEAAELDESDVLVRGRSRATGGEAFLVVEVSAKVDTDDVERAVERAEILRKARPEAEVIPVAAGPEIHPLAARAARDHGVWWLTDGRPYAPHEIPG